MLDNSGFEFQLYDHGRVRLPLELKTGQLNLSFLICEVGTEIHDLMVYSKAKRVTVCKALYLGHEGSIDGK